MAILRDRMNRRLRRGTVILLVCLLLPVLFIFAALAINMAYLQLAQTELQISTDIATRAAGRVFAETGDKTAAFIKALEAGEHNLVGGDPLLFQYNDLEIGASLRPGLNSRYEFTSSSTDPNAVRLRGARTNLSPSGPVAAYLPTFLASNSFELSAEAIASQSEVDIVLVLDRSGSMAYADNEPSGSSNPPQSAPPGWALGDAAPPDSRWLDAVGAVVGLLVNLEQTPQTEFVGMATYATESALNSDLSSNYFDITSSLDAISAQFDGGSTNIYAGLNEGHFTLAGSANARPIAAKVIILLTDGRANQGGDVVAAAAWVASQGTMIHTVTFSSEADIGLMQRVAAAGRGKHFHATSGSDLIAVFSEIGRSLPNLITK